MYDFMKKSWLVITSALVFGLLVAVVHGALEQTIAKNARDKLEREMKSLFGQDSSSEPVNDEAGQQVLYYLVKDPTGVTAGYAFEAVGGGFADKIKLLVGTDEQMENLVGIAILKTNETPGFGDKIKNDPFRGQFKNCPLHEKILVVTTGDAGKLDREIVAITGATISSEAVTKIVNDSVIAMRKVIKKETF